jgi:hypothetical protein
MMLQPLTSLTADFTTPHFFSGMPLRKINLWLGRAGAANGSRSRMHVDDFDNLYVLLRGRKSVSLFCPADAGSLATYGPLLQVFPNGQLAFGAAPDGHQSHFSRIILNGSDPMAAAYAEFPHFRQLIADGRRLTVELIAGDMLYIPAGWAHEVTSYDSHMALNFWSTPPEALVIEHALETLKNDDERSRVSSQAYQTGGNTMPNIEAQHASWMTKLKRDWCGLQDSAHELFLDRWGWRWPKTRADAPRTELK